MIYELECRKADFVPTLAQALIDDGTFTMVSSNTANDRIITAGCSDGYVFRSSDNINGRKFILAIKNIDTDNNALNTQINLMLSNDYEPSGNPNTNGVFGAGSGRRAYYLTSQASLTLDAIIRIHLDIKPHRIIMVTYKAIPTLENPSLIYIGYPELSTNIERYYMQNLFILGTNCTVTGPLVAKDALNQAWATHKLYTLLAPTNPNVAGDYNMSPIFVGTAIESIYGALDGVWVMPATNISQLDELEQNGDRFRVFKLTQAVGSNGFTDLGTISNLAFVVRRVR